MSDSTRQKPDSKKPAAGKAKYEKPALRSEKLTAVAALCNGTTTGSRKATTPACNASRLKS
jgi:hypothetical protein